MLGSELGKPKLEPAPFMAMARQDCAADRPPRILLAAIVAECAVKTDRDARVHLTPARWNELVAVNNAVNTTITPATDEECSDGGSLGLSDRAGDCEDFVLLKRRTDREGLAGRRPADHGGPPDNGDGHAVLTVLTDRGDLVLDNLDPQIKVWSETDYQFVKRQSEFDSGQWVAIDDARTYGRQSGSAEALAHAPTN